MTTISTIKQRINCELTPEILEVSDESYSHANHYVREDENDVSHVKIRIKCSAFEGCSKIKCHQMIYKIFDAELKSGEIHAMKIEVIC